MVTATPAVKDNAADTCPVTGNGHHWRLEAYERGIKRGECRCGAERYFVGTDTSKEFVARAEALNREHGKEGKPMVVQIPESKLHPETRQQLGLDTAAGRPPVPARPSIEGLNRKRAVTVVHDYYMANKEAILADLAALGSTAARKHWDIPDSTWRKLIPRLQGKPRGGKAWKRPQTIARHKATVIEPEVETAAAVETASETAAALPTPEGGRVGPLLEIGAKFWLPPFPAFDATWPAVTQVKWMETYLVLVKG